MEISLTTPALLFPAISLLLLAYTNRFLALAALIRDLHSKYVDEGDERLMAQIHNLQKRVILIRNMQAWGIGSLFLCVFCMLVLFIGQMLAGKILFAVSLIFMLTSLGLSLREIQISVHALQLRLDQYSHEK